MQTKAGGAQAELTGGYVEHRYGVTNRTLCFYEQCGFLSPKRFGAIRLYSSYDIARLEIILAGKKLGLPLKEIAAIIRSKEIQRHTEAEDGHAHISLSICQQMSLLEAQRERLDATIGELNSQLVGETMPDPKG